MARVLSEPTYGELVKLIADRAGFAPARGPRASAQLAFVRCESTTAAGGNDVLDQCYPATVLFPAGDYPFPPEEGGDVLLSLLGEDGESVEPQEGGVYLAIVGANAPGDASGSGSTYVDGRPRAFAAVGVGEGVTIEGPGGGSYPGTTTVTYSNYYTVTNPSPGRVLVSGPPGGSDRITGLEIIDGKLRLNFSHTAPDGTVTAEFKEVPICDIVDCCAAGDLSVTAEGGPGDVAPLEVGFTSTVTNGVGTIAYGWDFDDGATSTDANPTHTFTDPGLYEVVLTITDECGRSASWVEYVYVYDDPCACGDGSIRWPIYLDFELTGATGDFADMNGVWRVYLYQSAGVCHWRGDLDTGPGRWRVVVGYVGTYALDLDFVSEDGVSQVSYTTASAGTPCGPFVGVSLVSSVGTGTKPTFVLNEIDADGDCGVSCLPFPGCAGAPGALQVDVVSALPGLNGYSGTASGGPSSWTAPGPGAFAPDTGLILNCSGDVWDAVYDGQTMTLTSPAGSPTLVFTVDSSSGHVSAGDTFTISIP